MLAQRIWFKIQEENWLDFDVCVATPDMMGLVGRLGRILGQRINAKPQVRHSNHGCDKSSQDIKAGKVEYRVDRTGIIHVPIGKVSFDTEKINENLFQCLYGRHRKAKPASAKGTYLKCGPGQHHGSWDQNKSRRILGLTTTEFYSKLLKN